MKARKEFYFCEATLKGAVSGYTSTFRAYTIAADEDEARTITAAQAEAVLPTGWEIASIAVTVFQRELLEPVAEEVLGWQRPDWVS